MWSSKGVLGSSKEASPHSWGADLKVHRGFAKGCRQSGGDTPLRREARGAFQLETLCACGTGTGPMIGRLGILVCYPQFFNHGTLFPQGPVEVPPENFSIPLTHTEACGCLP